MSKLKAKKDISITELYSENKAFFYSLLFYVSGLILGSFLCTYNNALTKILEGFFTLQINGFVNLFINRICLYLTVYSATVLLGMCLIGFPFINAIPLICGIEIGVKLSYYYINYSIKGIGYSLLMIIPESAAFITVIIYTIIKSSNLSRGIYSLTTKTDTAQDVNLKLYLKSFILYSLIVTLIAFVNAGAIYLLNSIISL